MLRVLFPFPNRFETGVVQPGSVKPPQYAA